MCWSATASIAATTVGAVATGYAAHKKVPKERAFALGYFTLMELIQALSYIWIGRCDMTGNTLLTYLGYAHIAFQMPVASMFMFSYVSVAVRKKWQRPVMIAAFAGTVMFLTKMIAPIAWDAPQQLMCRIGVDPLCGEKACSYMGNWHLAWRLPLLQLGLSQYYYFLIVFIVPMFYGNWRLSLYHFVLGPFLAFLTTTNHDEVPAIWCLFSIALLISMFFGPIKRWLEIPMREKATNPTQSKSD